MTSTGDAQQVTLIRTLDSQGPYKRLWQPFIAEWQPQHLLVAYGGELRGKVDMGDMLCCISTDDGASWSEPVTIFDHRQWHGSQRFAYANPVLFRPQGQSIVWCFAMRCPLYYRDSEDSQLCAAYTIDGGWSWQPVELAVHHHSPLITCAGVVEYPVDGGVRYLLGAHRNSLRNDPLGRQDQFVLESDNLLEWRLAGYVPAPETPAVFLHEGNIAEGDRPGELKIVMRTAKAGRENYTSLDEPTAYSSVSRDGGRNWSIAIPEMYLHNTTSKAYFGHSSTGSQLYVYSGGPFRERRQLNWKQTRPDGSWSEERLFFNGDTRNSYPTLLEYEPGRFYAVWDSSTHPDEKRTAIRFGRLDIN